MNQKTNYEKIGLFELDNSQINVSGSTVQNYESTVSGSTNIYFTETATLQGITWDGKPIEILKASPTTSNQLYAATGGIITPNYSSRFLVH